MNRERFAFLDVFKFWALFSLMFYHSFEAWVTGGTNVFIQDQYLETYRLISNIGLVFCYIPCLGMPFLSGVTLFLMSEKFMEDGKIKLSKKSIKFIFKRFLLIFLAAVLFSALNYGVTSVYETDILHCIAFSSLIIFILAAGSNVWTWIVISGLWVYYSKTIQLWAWGIEVPIGVDYLKVIFFGDREQNSAFYALTPWLAMDLLGFSMGYLFNKYKELIIKYAWTGWLLIVPSYFISSEPWVVDLNNFWSAQVFQPSPRAFLTILCCVISLLLILINIFNGRKLNNFIFLSFVKNIMWVYVVHTACIYRVYPWLYQFSEGNFNVFWSSQFLQLGFALILTLTISRIRNKHLTKA
jgi:hypothetical protein